MKLPRPAPPVPGALPVQEPGTRPSRALPYAPLLEEVRSEGDKLTLRFGNAGNAGAVYRVDDLRDLEAAPRH